MAANLGHSASVTCLGVRPIRTLPGEHFRWCFLSVFVNWEKIGSATRNINLQHCEKRKVSGRVCSTSLAALYTFYFWCPCVWSSCSSRGRRYFEVGAEPARPACCCAVRGGGWGGRSLTQELSQNPTPGWLAAFCFRFIQRGLSACGTLSYRPPRKYTKLSVPWPQRKNKPLTFSPPPPKSWDTLLANCC